MTLGGFDGGLELSDRSELTDTDIVAQVIYAHGRMSGSGFPTACFETAFETCYSSLAGAPVGGFETLRIIQDLASDSTTVRMRLKAPPASLGSHQNHSDEMQLAFLARGTLTILGWLATPSPEMADLCRAIQVLANGTLSVRSRVPAQRDLVRAVAALQDLKRSIPNAETVKIMMHRGAADLDLHAAPLDLTSLLRKTLLKSSDGEMILIVEEPDYLRRGTWRLRHGTQRLDARCDSGAIVDGFYRRGVDIRPGDALRCRVRVDRSYDSDNELLTEQLSIVEILEILFGDLAEQPTSFKAQEATDRSPEHRPEDGRVLEQVEGAFGVLTLREIPIN